MKRYVLTALVLSLISMAAIFAQSGAPGYGVLKGVVRDSGGALVPGVAVTMSNGRGVERSTVTGATGEFLFTMTAPGRYTVTATGAGFVPRRIVADVQDSRTTTLALTLAVAKREEKDNAPMAQPRAVDEAGGRIRRVDVPGVIAGVIAAPQPNASPAPIMPPRGSFNTEAYDRIVDNQWIDASRRPLSTFSTDVDTASYSNVRRFLNQGQTPPKDAVRIEELINYFSFDYPDPRDGKPVSITTAIGECPWNPSHRLALIGLQARRIDASTVPPRNLVFLIDVSGSMMPANKLPLVKASLAMLAPNLTSKDRVAIVVYAGSSGLVLPSTDGSDTSTILEALQRLEAGGSTNGGQGLALAYRTAQEHFIQNGVNRVILATDGDFNVGVTDQGSLVRMIEEKRKTGIALSVLGYGMGNVKDSTMEKLADSGNGNYAYIDSLAEARKVLVEQAGGTLVTVAEDVKLQVEFNPRVVGAYRLIGYENRLLQDQDFNDDQKDAGDMGAGHSVTALYELIPAGPTSALRATAGRQPELTPVDPLKYQQPRSLSAAAKSGEAMTVKMRFKYPTETNSSLMSVAVSETSRTSPELGFASAVAAFGMVLRDSEFKGNASFATARRLAETFRGVDPHGHRAAFVRLIDAADDLTQRRTTTRFDR